MTNTKRTIEKWSAAEEARLADMLERKRAFYEQYQPAVLRIAIELSNGIAQLEGATRHVALKELLINNADEVRDVLAPFDTGVRVAPGGEG